MAGYIVELYKNIRSAEGYQPKGKTVDENAKQNYKRKTYVTFGDFDKMAFSRVAAFSRMRDMSELSRTWIGDRQTLLLYEIDNENTVVYQDTKGIEGFYVKSNEGIHLSDNLFIAVSILQFKESTDRTNTDMDQCLKTYRENILALINANQTEGIPVYCSVFGTLGTYGLAIVWLSDQFVEILRLINYIKGIDVKTGTESVDYDFLSLFSIFAKNNLKDELAKDKLTRVEGTALLQVTLESNLNSTILKRFKDELQANDFFHSAGEHDLIIKTKLKTLYRLFEQHKLLDPDEDFYRKNILQTNVRMCDDISVESIASIPERNTPLSQDSETQTDLSNTLSTFIKQVENCYKDLRKDFFENFPKTAGMVDSLDLLYGDFTSKISSVSNRMWAYDFGYQFLAILNVIKKYLKKVINKSIEIPTSEILADIREILNCYEYQIIHIAESNNLLIDTPNCHLRYTGQNNLTLYAYFGITKDVITLCYLMQGKSRQSKITPLISVDIVPIIESTMYIDYGAPDEDRVLKLNLPMMALYNMPEYIPYLYHEIFHYIVPEDRVVRNWIKGTVLSIIALRNLFSNLMKTYSRIDDEKLLERLISSVFLPEIYRSVCVWYHDELVEEIKNEKVKEYTVEEINKKSLEWKQYEKKLFYQLLNDASRQELILPQGNIIFNVLVDLYCQKDELKKTAERMPNISTDATAIPSITEGVENLMAEISGMANNTKNETKTAAYNELLKGTQLSGWELLHMRELLQISTALSEVASDIPMAELANMRPVHYMISYVNIQDDLLKDPEGHPKIQDSVRIGIALDFFMGFDNPSDYNKKLFASYEDEFIRLYVGLYFSARKALKDPAEYLEKLKDKAQQWLSWINKAYIRYLKEYRIYGSIFREIINQSSIRGRKKDSAEMNIYRDIFEGIKGLKCGEYYDALQVYGTGIIDAIEKSPVYQKENIAAEISSCKETFDNALFKINIWWIHAYQRQDKFDSMDQFREDHSNGKKLYKKENVTSVKLFQNPHPAVDWNTVIARRGKENYQYEISGIEDLCRVTEKISRKFSRQNKETYGSNDHGIWYRGQSRVSYQLIPSAMRKYVQQRNQSDSLLTYQRAAYEEFTFRMDNASEKPDKASYTVCDYLALMQHYGAPTIYMDWSENALSSLYFALEAYIDPKKSNEQNNDDAVLYMLHPNLYNKARTRIMKKVDKKTGRGLDACLKETKQENTNSLPNLSVEYNKNRYCMFLLGEVDKGVEIPDSEDWNFVTLMDNNDEEKYLYLPLAIYSSRANARIRAQFGMFMAYNIFTPLGKKNSFDYISLDNIQKFFLSSFNDATPFMYKIIIKSESKKQIAGWLKSIGVSKHMIYPELSNIGEKI